MKTPFGMPTPPRFFSFYPLGVGPFNTQKMYGNNIKQAPCAERVLFSSKK
jgi:hypothetical protein